MSDFIKPGRFTIKSGLLFLLLLPLLLAGEIKPKLKVRVVQLPPVYYLENGRWTGLDAELLTAIINKAGYEPDFLEMSFKRGIYEIKKGNIHIMSNLTKSEQRSEFLYWLGPVRYTSIGLIVKEGNENVPITNLDDIVKLSKKKGINFGIHQGAFYSTEFNKRFENDPEFRSCFETASNMNTNIKKTKTGRIIGFFTDTFEMSYGIKYDPQCTGLSVHQFTLEEDDPLLTGAYVGITKTIDQKILQSLFEAYDSLEKDGTLNKITTSWERKF